MFVGSGIFKGENPAARAKAMCEACSHYLDARIMARGSEGLGTGMVGVQDGGETAGCGCWLWLRVMMMIAACDAFI